MWGLGRPDQSAVGRGLDGSGIGLGNLDRVGGAAGEDGGTGLVGLGAHLADGFGGDQRAGAVVDVHQAGVAFTGVERREDRVLTGFAAGHEVDRGGGRQVGGEQPLEFGELGVVAISDDHAADQARAQE